MTPNTATEVDLDDAVAQHGYHRLTMLSDGIFAIATTLAALEIRLPEHAVTMNELMAGAGRNVVAYVISFLVIAVFWISNRDLFARVRQIDPVLTVLTLAMLCVTAVIPACAHAVYIQGNTDAAFRFYALVMTGCGLLNTAMWAYAGFRPEIMLDRITAAYRWQRVIVGATMPLLFGVLFLLPGQAAVPILLPLAGVLVVLRRIVIPRLFHAHPAQVG